MKTKCSVDSQVNVTFIIKIAQKGITLTVGEMKKIMSPVIFGSIELFLDQTLTVIT